MASLCFQAALFHRLASLRAPAQPPLYQGSSRCEQETLLPLNPNIHEGLTGAGEGRWDHQSVGDRKVTVPGASKSQGDMSAPFAT